MQIQIDELHAEDIFMYFKVGIPRTHLQYVNIKITFAKNLLWEFWGGGGRTPPSKSAYD
jgi:hypothetical protein